MQTIVYHSKARKTMCGMGTFCLIGMISFQLTMQNGDKVKLRPGYSQFELWYNREFPNVLYVYNIEDKKLYYTRLTENS